MRSKNRLLLLIVLACLVFSLAAKANDNLYVVDAKKSLRFPSPENVSYNLLQAQIFKEGQEVNIKPDKPLPFSSHDSRLCFFIGFTVKGEDPKKGLSTLLENTFGKEEYDNVWEFSPLFLEGVVHDSDNKTYALTGERYLQKSRVDSYPAGSQVGQYEFSVSVCSTVEGQPRDVAKISFSPKKTFKAESVFWQDTILEYYP